MSVIAVNEIGRGRRRGEIGTSYISGYSRHFQVVTNTPFDGTNEVIAGALTLGLPSRGAVYTQPQTGFVDASSVCIRIAAQQQQEDDERKWLIECQYSSEYQPPIENFNPNNDAPLFRWGNEVVAEGMQNDLNGVPIVNSANDPFQAQTRERGRLTLTITRNQPYFDYGLAEYFLESVNYYPIWGYGRGQVLLKEFSATGPSYRNGFQYWPHTLVFKLDRTYVRNATTTGLVTNDLSTMPTQLSTQPAGGGHLDNNPVGADDIAVAAGNTPVTSFEILQLLDAGKRELDPNNTGKLRPILAGASQVSEPVMLDGNGTSRPLGPAVWLFFTQRWALDWTALNLPLVIAGA